MCQQVIGSLERRLILSQFSEVSLQAIRTALLAFLLVFVRAQPGLVRFNDLDFRFVSIRAHAVAIVSWLALVLLVLILSGELAVYAVIAASAWAPSVWSRSWLYSASRVLAALSWMNDSAWFWLSGPAAKPPAFCLYSS